MSTKRSTTTTMEISSPLKKARAGLEESKGESCPTTAFKNLKYLNGFGAELESEALEGALPKGQNTPQICPYGLHAEQLSGSSFTTPRVHNQRSWLYRIRPTCKHAPFKPVSAEEGKYLVNDFSQQVINPNQLRWKPFPMPQDGEQLDFVQGLKTLAGAGAPDVKTGMAIHIYACNKSMGNKAFCNSDGDMLIVPQQGTLYVRTEFGLLEVAPREICVIQRGIRFTVDIDGPSRGYICEVYNGHFKLPDLGPIGANGLANPRDFQSPVAAFEDKKCSFEAVQKFMGKLFTTTLEYSPYDVVAWFGNYVPYKYNLWNFCAVNSVTFDHMDPSIFTVLTCPSAEPGVAVADFVIFPPRWLVQEKTFRPPYYHRNCMSEFMGNIEGRYEAKPEGFLPGGGSLHSVMMGHGPDADTYNKASQAELKPVKLPEDSLAFMFESTYMFKLTQWGNDAPKDEEYYKCWEGVAENFDPENPHPAPKA